MEKFSNWLTRNILKPNPIQDLNYLPEENSMPEKTLPPCPFCGGSPWWNSGTKNWVYSHRGDCFMVLTGPPEAKALAWQRRTCEHGRMPIYCKEDVDAAFGAGMKQAEDFLPVETNVEVLKNHTRVRVESTQHKYDIGETVQTSLGNGPIVERYVIQDTLRYGVSVAGGTLYLSENEVAPVLPPGHIDHVWKLGAWIKRIYRDECIVVSNDEYGHFIDTRDGGTVLKEKLPKTNWTFHPKSQVD